MPTPLQRAFAKSAIRRTLAFYFMKDNGLPIKGYKRMFNEIIGEVFGTQSPEAKIKEILYYALNCYDTPADLREEAVKLLAISSTALTEKQRRKFDTDI